MDRVSFTIWAVVGKTIALVAFFQLGDKRKARIPPIVSGFAWLFGCLPEWGMAMDCDWGCVR